MTIGAFGTACVPARLRRMGRDRMVFGVRLLYGSAWMVSGAFLFASSLSVLALRQTAQTGPGAFGMLGGLLCFAIGYQLAQAGELLSRSRPSTKLGRSCHTQQAKPAPSRAEEDEGAQLALRSPVKSS